MIENDDVVDKYNEIQNKIKNTPNIRFYRMPVCDQKYIKIIGQKHIDHFAEFGKVKLFLEWLLLG